MTRPEEQISSVISILDAVDTISISSENYGEIYELLRSAKYRLWDLRNALKSGSFQSAPPS